MSNQKIILASFFSAALLAGYLAMQIVDSVLAMFEVGNPLAGTGLEIPWLVGLLVGGIAFYVFYNREDINSWANIVVKEVRKITWPTYKEAKAATLVVIVLTGIVAVILGIFDWVFASLTGIIYS